MPTFNIYIDYIMTIYNIIIYHNYKLRTSIVRIYTCSITIIYFCFLGKQTSVVVDYICEQLFIKKAPQDDWSIWGRGP